MQSACFIKEWLNKSVKNSMTDYKKQSECVHQFECALRTIEVNFAEFPTCTWRVSQQKSSAEREKSSDSNSITSPSWQMQIAQKPGTFRRKLAVKLHVSSHLKGHSFLGQASNVRTARQIFIRKPWRLPWRKKAMLKYQNYPALASNIVRDHPTSSKTLIECFALLHNRNLCGKSAQVVLDPAAKKNRRCEQPTV